MLNGKGLSIIIVLSILVIFSFITQNNFFLILNFSLLILLFLHITLFYKSFLKIFNKDVKIKIIKEIDDSELITSIEEPTLINLELSNNTRFSLPRFSFKIRSSQDIIFEPFFNKKFKVSPYSSLKIPIKFRCNISGRYLIAGIEFRFFDYFNILKIDYFFSNPITILILPKGLELQSSNFFRKINKLYQRLGITQVFCGGSGYDLNKIRDYLSGDPLKSIAWKATARTNKVLVKEYIHEVELTGYILLDISHTMRTKPLEFPSNVTKLEFGINIAATIAKIYIDHHDLIGLITFDSQIYDNILPKKGINHYLKIAHTLSLVNNVVDEKRTSIDNDKLLEIAREAIEAIFGSSIEDEDFILTWLDNYLSLEKERYFRGKKIEELNYYEKIRYFCHKLGILFPYKEAKKGEKDQGISSALNNALRFIKSGSLIFIITDLTGYIDIDFFIKNLKMVVSKKNNIIIFVPFTPWFEGVLKDKSKKSSSFEKVIEELTLKNFIKEQEQILKEIEKLNIPVLVSTPEDAIITILGKIAAFKRRTSY